MADAPNHEPDRADPFHLHRFLEAQEGRPGYQEALEELEQGRKRSHWMWFIFPQMAGLGRSATAQHFALGGLAEASAYLSHPVLGSRLRECTRALTRFPERSADEILGPIDALKLRSSMTLFALADPGEPLFRQVLRDRFAGEPDPLTLELLEDQG